MLSFNSRRVGGSGTSIYNQGPYYFFLFKLTKLSDFDHLSLHITRRKAFWVAKQILQLGMGDALDDWVLEKIRILRRGTVVASGIQRVEQVREPLPIEP